MKLIVLILILLTFSCNSKPKDDYRNSCDCIKELNVVKEIAKVNIEKLEESLEKNKDSIDLSNVEYFKNQYILFNTEVRKVRDVADLCLANFNKELLTDCVADFDKKYKEELTRLINPPKSNIYSDYSFLNGIDGINNTWRDINIDSDNTERYMLNCGEYISTSVSVEILDSIMPPVF